MQRIAHHSRVNRSSTSQKFWNVALRRFRSPLDWRGQRFGKKANKINPHLCRLHKSTALDMLQNIFTKLFLSVASRNVDRRWDGLLLYLALRPVHVDSKICSLRNSSWNRPREGKGRETSLPWNEAAPGFRGPTTSRRAKSSHILATEIYTL